MALLFFIVLTGINIFFGAFILFKASKLFRVQEASYKKSIFITLSLEIFGFVVGFIAEFVTLHILVKFFILVLYCLIFTVLFKRYYFSSWKKTLAVYIVYSVFIAICIGMPMGLIFQSANVDGSSMSPHFFTGDVVTIEKISRHYHRDDVIVIKKEDSPDLILKRIIGLPSEKIELLHGQIFINGIVFVDTYVSPITTADMSVTLSADEYFVLGDNSAYSTDSRVFGPVKSHQIIGKFFARATWQKSLYKFLHLDTLFK